MNETIAETVSETVAAATEAVTEATEAALTLMEELAPVYDLQVLEMNISIVIVCALGIIAGILIGLALWRWLK